MSAQERSLVILTCVNKVPTLAGCTNCKRKFFTSKTYHKDILGAEQYLRGKFDLHKCEDSGHALSRLGPDNQEQPRRTVTGAYVKTRWLITRLNFKLAATGGVITKTPAKQKALGAYQLWDTRNGTAKYLSRTRVTTLARQLGLLKPRNGNRS